MKTLHWKIRGMIAMDPWLSESEIDNVMPYDSSVLEEFDKKMSE